MQESSGILQIEMNEIERFNIRVYGILINDKNEILLAHERMGEFEFTKFPGGGLEFGEGIKECLIREFREEAGIEINDATHFYTTDFFQQSAFRKNDQIISVYYKVTSTDDLCKIRLDEFELKGKSRIEIIQFKWYPLKKINDATVDLPIDKVVCKMLKAELK